MFQQQRKKITDEFTSTISDLRATVKQLQEQNAKLQSDSKNVTISLTHQFEKQKVQEQLAQLSLGTTTSKVNASDSEEYDGDSTICSDIDNIDVDQ